MARLNIPAQFRSSLQALADLPDEVADQLTEAFKNASAKIDPSRFADEIFRRTSNSHLTNETISELIEALFALSSLRYAQGLKVEELIADVTKGILSDGGATKESQQLFRSRLTILLSSEALILSSRGTTLQRDHQRTLMECLVLTDMRPIFSESGEEVKAGMIIHTLKLVYFEGPDLKEFFVALDDADVEKLKAGAMRAQTKSKALRAMLSENQIEDLNGN